jgi:hypothetical protein
MGVSKDINKFILAWLIVVGFFATGLYLLDLVQSGKEIKDASGAVFMLLGALVSKFSAVVDYFFGSTQASSDKTNQLVDMAKTGTFPKPPCPPEVKDAGAPVK